MAYSTCAPTLSLREFVGSLMKSATGDSAEGYSHCIFQDEFLLQYVPPNVSPPELGLDMPSSSGYILASSYVSTHDEVQSPRHEVACLRPPTTLVVCGTISGGGSAEERPVIVAELHNALSKGDRVHVATELGPEALTALTADDARYLLSQYTSDLKLGDGGLPALWVMCTPSKPAQLTWLAGFCKATSSDSSSGSARPMAFPAPCQLFSCRYLGSILRPSSLLDSPTSFFPLPSLRALLSHGCVPLNKHGDLEMQDHAGVFVAEYEIIGSFSLLSADTSAMDSTMLDDLDCSGSLLAVRYTWENGSTVLSCPPSSSSAVVLVRAVSNDLRSPAARLLRELNQLEAWLKVFEMDDEAARGAWRQANDSSDTAFDRAPAFAQEVQTRTAEDLMQWRPDEGRHADLDTISSHMLPVRQDLDFSQLFWLLVKDAVSVKDASRCLLHVSRALLRQDVQPMVYRENATALADLVRQCLQCTSQEQLTQVSAKLLSSTGSNLLKALAVVLQTGFHKLERDFVHFFVSEELATWNQLAPFLVTSFPSSEQAQEACEWYRRQFQCLRSLHCCLELVLMCKAYLSLPSESLRVLLRSALEYYAKQENTEHPIFCLPLPKNAKDCLGICIRNLPSSWSCSVSNGGTSTTVRLCTNPPHHALEEEETQGPDGKALTRFHVTQSVVTTS